jgi:acetyl esterase
MMWCWEQYTRHPGERGEITASPLQASILQLRGLPPALIITAEADVLGDEGEAYPNKLRQAGVRLTAARSGGTIHDFVTLNALATSAAAREAITLATAWLREGFSSRPT